MDQPYKPTKVWSLLALAGFGFIILFEAFLLLLAILQVINPATTVELDDGETMSVWLLAQGIISVFYVLVGLATIVFFLIWLNKSYKNLHALRPNYLQFSSGWAVAYWFIPFVWFWRPFQVVREIWWESDPVIPDEHSFLTESLHGAPTYMGVWWGLFIASNVVNNFQVRLPEPQGPTDVYILGIITIISSLLTIPAAILAAMVVRDITTRQAARHLSVIALEQSEAAAAAAAYRQQQAASGWQSNDEPGVATEKRID